MLRIFVSTRKPGRIVRKIAPKLEGDSGDARVTATVLKKSLHRLFLAFEASKDSVRCPEDEARIRQRKTVQVNQSALEP